jgi:hypothetical protein
MKKYGLFALIITVITGCEPEEEISWKVDEIPQRLVVEGSITSEFKIHTVTLKKSANYFSNTAAEVVSDASVTITDGINIFYLEENPPGSGIYKTTEEVKGDTGRFYILDIHTNEPLNNETHFSASSLLKRTIRTDSMTSMLFDSPFQFINGDSVILVNTIFGHEYEPEGDYYMLSLYRNGTLLNDTIDEYITFYDRNSGMDGKDILPFAFLENYIAGDTVEIEIRSISKTYYDFIEGVKMISRGTDPFGFSGPPANPAGNIEGGNALGFFNASAVTRARSQVIRQD